MSTDLQTQIRHYTGTYVSDIPPVEIAEITAVRLHGPSTAPTSDRPQIRRRPAWVYALVAALVVLLFGWVAILLRNSADPVPPVTQPTPSGANGWIAISTDDGVQSGDIYLTREGESPRRIIGSDNDGIEQDCPVFSPDGSKLAYIESDWDVPMHKVVIGEFDGGFEPLVSFTTTGPRSGCITWSPDSTRVAYMSRPNSYEQLQVGTLDGEETTLYEGLNGHFDLDWSPDGSAIALLGPPYLGNEVSTAAQKVWVVPVDGSGARTLVESDGQSLHFDSITWSPDGSQLAIRQASTSGPYVRVVGVDGATDHAFLTGGFSQFDEVAWSPDGSTLAWVEHDVEPEPKINRVMVADVDGNDPVALASYQQGGEAYFPPYFVNPIWSADGRRILIPMASNANAAAQVLVALSLDPEIEPLLIAELDGIGPGDSVSWQVER